MAHINQLHLSQISDAARVLALQTQKLQGVLTKADSVWSQNCTSPSDMAHYFTALFSALPEMWNQHTNSAILVHRCCTLFPPEDSSLEQEKAIYLIPCVKNQLAMLQGVTSCSKIADALGTFASELFRVCSMQSQHLNPDDPLYENQKSALYNTMLSLTHYLGMIKDKHPEIKEQLETYNPILMAYLKQHPTAVLQLNPHKPSDDLTALDSFVDILLSSQTNYLKILSLIDEFNSDSPESKSQKEKEIVAAQETLAHQQASLQEMGHRITVIYNSILGRDLNIEPLRFSVAAALFKLHTSMNLIQNQLVDHLVKYSLAPLTSTATNVKDDASSRELFALASIALSQIKSSREAFLTPTTVAEFKEQAETHEYLKQEQAEAHGLRCARFVELFTHISTLPEVAPQELCIILTQLIEHLEDTVVGLEEEASDFEQDYIPIEAVRAHYDQELFQKTTALVTHIKTSMQSAQAEPGKHLLRDPFPEVLTYLLQLNITNYPQLIELVSNTTPAEQNETYSLLLHLLQQQLPAEQFTHTIEQLETYRLQNVPLNRIIIGFLSHLSQNEPQLTHFLLSHLLSINRLSIVYVHATQLLSKHISENPTLSEQLSPLHNHLSSALAQFYATLFPTLCQYVHESLIPSLGELTGYTQQIWLPKQTLSHEDAQLELATLDLQENFHM